MRFIGRREGVSADLRADGLGRGDDRRQTSGSPCSSPSTTAAGRRSSTRREAFEGGTRRSSAPPLRARDARSRPPDPDQRRAAALQLPALAVRLLGARLPRRALARLRRARPSRSALRGVRGAPAPLRGPVAAWSRGERGSDARRAPSLRRRRPQSSATTAARWTPIFGGAELAETSREPFAHEATPAARRSRQTRRRRGDRRDAEPRPGRDSLDRLRDRDHRRGRASSSRWRWSASASIGAARVLPDDRETRGRSRSPASRRCRR